METSNAPICKICGETTRLFQSNLFDDRYGYPGKFNVFVCNSCGCGQTQPEMSGKALDDLYTNYYPRKDITKESVQASANWKPGTMARMFRYLHGTNNTCHYAVQPGTRVLDVGCGNGASLLEIQRMGAEAFGTEQDRNVEKIANELNLKIFFGNVEDADYPNEYFDTITLSQVLEHIPKPIDFLSFLATKLKPGGNIIMSFPNINSIYQKKSGKRWINWHIPYHLNFFSEQSLNVLAEKTHLRIKKIMTITPNVWVALQERNNRFSPTPGKPSPVWTNVSEEKKSTVWKQRFEALRGLAISLLKVPLLRVRDHSMKGDSFLVIMEKR